MSIEGGIYRTFLFDILSLPWLYSLGDSLAEQGHELAIAEVQSSNQ